MDKYLLLKTIKKNFSDEINKLEEKILLNDDDVLLIEDSENEFSKKKVKVDILRSNTSDTNSIHKNLPNEINSVSEKTSISENDILLIEDSDDNWNKKKIALQQLGITTSGGNTYVNADTLDGLDSSDFVRKTGNVDENITGNKTFENNVEVQGNLTNNGNQVLTVSNSIKDLSDVNSSMSPNTDEALVWNGSQWSSQDLSSNTTINQTIQQESSVIARRFVMLSMS